MWIKQILSAASKIEWDARDPSDELWSPNFTKFSFSSPALPSITVRAKIVFDPIYPIKGRKFRNTRARVCRPFSSNFRVPQADARIKDPGIQFTTASVEELRRIFRISSGVGRIFHDVFLEKFGNFGIV